MAEEARTWYDSFFEPFYKWNHRYFVEFLAVLVLGLIVHLCYGVLAERQGTFAKQDAKPETELPPTLSIGAITNSGSESSTVINQSTSPRQDRKRR